MQFVVSVTYQNAKTYKRKRNKRTPIPSGLRFGLNVRALFYVYYSTPIYLQHVFAGSIIYPDTYFWPFRRRGFTMFIILLLFFWKWNKKTANRVWNNVNRASPKAFERCLLRAAFFCPGRWSLRLAPLTVHALGSRSPSGYDRTLRRWATLTYVWSFVCLAAERCTKLRSTDEKVKWLL